MAMFDALDVRSNAKRGRYGLDFRPHGSTPTSSITLSANSISEAASSGTTIGTLSVVNAGTGWSFAITSQTPASKLAISSADLNTAAALGYNTNADLSVTVTASKSGEADVVTTLTIHVLAVLGDLALDSYDWVPGTPASGTITGAHDDEVITLGPGWPSGLSVDSAPRTWAYDGSGSDSSGTGSLIGTHPQATNSPHTTSGLAWTLVSVAPSAPINALEVLGPTSIDPQGSGPYGFQGNGTLLRINIDATVAAALSEIDPTKITVTIGSPGYDNNGGAGPISAVTRSLVVTPRAVLRRQADGTTGSGNITNTTQVCVQGGSLTAAPTIGTAADYYLVLPIHVFAGDTISVSCASGWCGSLAAGAGPAVTNSSTVTAAQIAQPLYGWFHTPCPVVNATSIAAELQVAGHRYGWMGGGSNVQMVAGVDIWATDGTNNGAVSTVTSVGLSDVQTLNGRAEVFKATVDLSGVNDTDGSTTLGSGRQYLDAYIYPWRGTRYQISTDGVAWPTPQPCTVHPFIKDTAGKFSGAFAPVRSDGVLTGASIAGILTTYPASQPSAANSYTSINTAMTALAAWHNQTGGGRPASPVLHNNQSGGRVLLVNTTGAAQGYELTTNVTPAAAMQGLVDIESWSGNAAECFYDATASRTFTGGFVRFKVRMNKNGGNVLAGDTTANSVATILALENAAQTWSATSTTQQIFRSVAMVYLFNVDQQTPNVTNVNAAGLSQETTSPYRCAKAIGVKFGDNTTAQIAELRPYHVVGLSGRVSQVTNPTASRQSTNDGMIIYNCRFNAFVNSVMDFAPASATDEWTRTRGSIIWQNVFEGTASGGCNVGFQAGSTTASVRNILWGFNTGVHDPADDNTTLQSDDRNGFSLCYRDQTATLGTTADMVIAGNLAPRYAIKSDYFTLINSGGGRGNVGNFTVNYGVDCMANVMLINRPLANINDASQFDWRANDPWTVTNQGIVTWTNNRCSAKTWASGDGFGDYSLKAAAAGGNNIGKGVIPAGMAWNRYDAAAIARKNAAAGATGTTGAAGAFEATD